MVDLDFKFRCVRFLFFIIDGVVWIFSVLFVNIFFIFGERIGV